MNQTSLPWDVFLPIDHPCVKKDRYAISPNGVIRNVITGEICKQFFDERGIAYVPILDSYGKNDIYVMRQVDELVAWEFLPEEDRDLANGVFHLDGKNDNNYYKNLEWIPWQTINPDDIIPRVYSIC